ncbi:hypothetical protein H4R34_000502 [Dimargaris verticillata]|uniref:Uncharacterized protein n=1 Tax=Dimargaris verticillata TaxID=2761393 RepID=A0A9W8BA88_9FUNG|nr:hypothetical protein H4R34_000502 [Dimargaris verticillata]
MASSCVSGGLMPTAQTTEWWLGPVPIFRCNQPALFSIYTRDYLRADSTTDRTLHEALLHALRSKGHQFAPFDHVDLVTTPRVFGYGFNPISFYFCYHATPSSTPTLPDPKETHLQLSCVVYEVHNTFGEKHIYVMTQSADTSRTPRFPTHTLPRVFHVSPFNDRQGYYRAETHDLRQGSLKVVITYYENPSQPSASGPGPDQFKESAAPLPSRPPKKFVATVAGPAYVLNRWSLGYLVMMYPITAFLTMPRILYQAAILAYRHRLAVYPKPSPMPVNLGKNPPTNTERVAMDIVTQWLSWGWPQATVPNVQVSFILPSGQHIICHSGSTEAHVAAVHQVTVECATYGLFTGLVGSFDPLTALFEAYTECQWDCSDLPRFLGLFSAVCNASGNAELTQHGVTKSLRTMQYLRRGLTLQTSPPSTPCSDIAAALYRRICKTCPFDHQTLVLFWDPILLESVKMVSTRVPPLLQFATISRDDITRSKPSAALETFSAVYVVLPVAWQGQREAKRLLDLLPSATRVQCIYYPGRANHWATNPMDTAWAINRTAMACDHGEHPATAIRVGFWQYCRCIVVTLVTSIINWGFFSIAARFEPESDPYRIHQRLCSYWPAIVPCFRDTMDSPSPRPKRPKPREVTSKDECGCDYPTLHSVRQNMPTTRSLRAAHFCNMLALDALGYLNGRYTVVGTN